MPNMVIAFKRYQLAGVKARTHNVIATARQQNSMRSVQVRERISLALDRVRQRHVLRQLVRCAQLAERSKPSRAAPPRVEDCPKSRKQLRASPR